MRYLKVIYGFSLCSALLSINVYSEPQPVKATHTTFITRIDKVDLKKYATSSGYELVGILEFSEAIPCGDQEEKEGYILQGNNQLDEEGLIEKFRALWKQPAAYYKVTLERCDPTKLKLKNIVACQADSCPDKYLLNNKIWLTEKYKVTTNIVREANYFIQPPFKQSDDKKSWVVEGWYADDILYKPISDKKPELAFKAQITDPEFKNQQFVGELTRYFGNGKVANQQNYNENGKLDGPVLAYYSEGMLSQKGNYVNGNLEGDLITYHKNGKIESDVKYHDNKAVDGLCIHHFDDGTVSRKHTYKDGQYNGEVLEYYPNGKIQKKQMYNKGKLEESMSYREDGTKKQYDVIKNGVQRVYKLWYQSDKPFVDRAWNEDGKEVGDQKQWYENGNLKEVINYDNGILQKETMWDEDGHKISENLYQDGKRKEKSVWNKDGTLNYRYKYDKDGKKIEESK